MSDDQIQILQASVIMSSGGHAIVQAVMPGGGDPFPLRVPSPNSAIATGEIVHVRVKSKTNLIADAYGSPGDFGPLTPAPPKVADVLAMVDRIALAADAPVVYHPSGRVDGEKPSVHTAPDGPLPVGILHPAYPPDYEMPKDLAQYGQLLARISERGQYVRGLVTGPTGTGKSTFVQAFAAQHGRPYCRVNMSAFVSPDEVFGQRTIVTDDGGHTTTGYDETPLVRAFQTPRCVIQIDEINRVHASVSNGMLDLLDDMLQAFIPGLNRTIHVDPSVIVLATMNQGVAYAGTFNLDAAMRSRLSYPLEVEYLDAKTEIGILVKKTGISGDAAKSLVELADDVRRRADPDGPSPLDFGISTRQLLAAGHMIGAGGASPAEAVRRTILPLYSTDGGTESQRTAVGVLIQGKFAA